MKITKEYEEIVNFYDKHPDAMPKTGDTLIPVCALPEIFDNFAIPHKNKILAIGSKHIYTMQLEKGYYSPSSDTNYHNLKKDNMLLLPSLIEEPIYVFFDNSKKEKENNEEPATLVFILDKIIEKENENEEGEISKTYETLVAFIKEPLDPKDNAIIFSTSYTKDEIDKYINWLIRNNRLLYLNEKKLHTQDNTGIYLPNATTLPLTGANTNNLHEYKKNVNKKRMKSNGLFLKDIPEKEKTEEICKLAILNNPLAFEYIPKSNVTPKLIYNLILKGNKLSFNYIPNEKYLEGFHYYLRNTKKNKKRPDIIYQNILRLSTESQQMLLLEAINPHHEPTLEEAIKYIIQHSNKNITQKVLKEPSLSNVAITENSSEIYQEEDVTKIINKTLEMKDGKLTEKGWGEISKTLQAYSDKRFETARYLFVQNGKIIRHVAISVQNPNATISKPDENVTYLEKLKTFAQNTNSSVVFVHNHPSGYVEPSLADQDTTQYLHNFFGNLFAGHIILDHGKFGIYEPKNQKWQALIDNKIYEMEEGKAHFSIHGSQIGIKQITNEKDLSILANYAKKIDYQANWNRDDWIPAFYSTHHGIVQSLEYIQNDDLKVENYQGLTNQIKCVGRDVGCNFIYLIPKTFEQKMLCEAFAQKTRIVQEIYFEKEDGTYELSNYSGGDIFSSITKEEIKMDDSINFKIINEEDKDIMEKTEQNPWFEKLSDIEKEAVLSDMRINPDLIGEYHSELAEADIDYKEYDRPSDEWFLNKINYKNLDGEFSYFNENNIGQQRHYAEVINEYKQELADKQEIKLEAIYKKDLEQDISIKASELIQNTSESVVTNFLLEKLNKAGIETISDKEIYENMLAYVKEVNICLEMLEAEQYHVQMMGEKEKGLEQDKQNILPPTSSKPIRKYITSIADCQAFSLKFEKLKTMITDSTPERFLQQLKETLETNDELDSNYVRRKIDGQKTELRISDHFSHAFDARFVDKTDSIVIKLTNNHFKPYKNAVLNEYVYHADTLTPEKKEQIIQGIQDWFITGEYTDKNYDDFHISPKEKLQQNLAEQMTLGGIKKVLMTGVALATMFCNMPKLVAETKITNPDEYKQTQIVQMETSLDIIHFEDGTKAICNTGNKNNLLNIAIILDESGKPIACHNYDDYMKLLETTGAIEKATVTKTNPIEVSMDAKKFVPFVNDWQQIGVVNDAFGGGSISEFDQQKYINLLNGWLTGEYSKQAQFMIQDSLTYGFTLNNKIYLNPELVNSNTIAHEYTHLWDKYTQKENPALWEQGKEIFKQTSLWNEVINDENYKAISNNEDLILSECHSRICGKFAEEVLNKIAKENGNEIKEEVIDWDKEVELFIAKEFGIKNPNYEMSNSISVKEQLAQENYNEFKNFLSQPMKDLIAGKEILKEHIIDNVELEKKLTNSTELNESINNEVPIMPNITDFQNSESNEVQILKNELDDVKAALKQFQSQLEHQKKENNTLRQENELLKGKINNINATQSIKETGEESIYREETKDTGTEINFNRNTAFNINCPIPPFGHEKEDGSIEIIENAHFAKHLLNKYDSASNKVILTYADEIGKHHEIEMHEREYRKMISACEEFAAKKNGVAENSYEWYLLHEKKAKIMKTDQNVLRLNFASNFIHNYRIMCKLYASNEGEAVKQAQKLVDMMHPNERRTFNKWRKQVGEKSFDNLLLKEFHDYVQGIENKESLILNNNELLYDVNKRYLEFQKDEEIVLTKNDKVIKNSGKKIGDTIKMAFKYESFGGKKLKTPMLEYQILKVTKNQFPNTVLLYNAEQKIAQTIPLKDFMKHIRKIEKQQLKENAEQIKKDYKIYGYEGR